VRKGNSAGLRPGTHIGEKKERGTRRQQIRTKKRGPAENEATVMEGKKFHKGPSNQTTHEGKTDLNSRRAAVVSRFGCRRENVRPVLGSRVRRRTTFYLSKKRGRSGALKLHPRATKEYNE